MAKKRLNKKVALIGSLVLLLFVLMAILVFLRLSRDPDKFIKDGDAAWQVKDYKNAERHYRSAIGLAKSGSLRKELLSKLEDIYVETSQWPKLRSCWEQIINIDPANIEARLGRLKYIYIIADNLAKTGRNSSAVWEDVQSQASELIKLVEGADLLMADRAESEPSFGIEEKQLSGISGVMGPYLYLLRARAAFA